MPAQILVLAFRRPQYLHAVLESLNRQAALNRTHVWIDGYSGLGQYARAARDCRHVAEEFRPASITALCGNAGINKMMLDAIWTLGQTSESLIVMEDDCFPSKSAVAEFERSLDATSGREDIFSVYGHPFLVEGEHRPFPRFQGWGFAAWTNRLLPVVEQARALYAKPEPAFLEWVRSHMSAEVRARLSVTPGRNAADVIEHLFAWDACFAMLTAMRGLMHLRTSRRVIYNCGLGGSHFSNDECFLRIPYNMVPFDQVWSLFEEPETPAPAHP